MIETSGAPRGQGLAQGRALEPEIRAAVAGLRAGQGWLAWRRALGAVHRTSGRELARFVPQLHERLQGMAAAAQVPLAALELAEAARRARVVAEVAGSTIEGTVAAPRDLALRLRRSEPDAGGFASVELVGAPLASALAGVNAEGIAVACLGDGPPGRASVRLLAQDVLYRTRTFASAVDHVRRRAPYLRAWGELLLVCASGESGRLELADGELRVAPAPSREAARAELRLDAVNAKLDWRGETALVVDAAGDRGSSA